MPPIDTIYTYAKINLILQVAPPISDQSDPNYGMHPICSWMHSIDLCDQITIEHMPDRESSYDIRWAKNRRSVEWDLDSDLIVRAHRLLEQECGRSLPVKIVASKKIPAGGGLGGGSSNAAGVLMGLNDLFELGYDECELQTIALKLGSDIPYFIDIESYQAGTSAKPAVISGIGNHIQRTPRLDEMLCILLPSFGCNTKEVYEAFDAMESSRTELDQDHVLRAAHSMKLVPSEIKNDLAESATMVQPQLAQLLNQLKELQIEARVSGSGSTVFVFEENSRSNLMDSLKALQTSGIESHPVRLK